MNFCSIEEAYNTPSFAFSRKKKACNGPPPPPTEMYEPRRDEFDGKEYARYMRYAGSGSGSGAGAGPAAARGAPKAAAAAAAATEPFQGGAFEPTYKAMQRDMKYYCNEYGVCTPGSKRGSASQEGFQSEIEYPAEPRAPRAPQAARGAAKAAPKAARAPPSCPLQPPRYEYPMSDESKQQFDAAMNLALDDDPRSSFAPLSTTKAREVDMDGVDGFYDEEIESYLKTKEMKSAPMPEVLTKATADLPGADKTPFAAAMSVFEKNKRPLLHPEPRPFGRDCEQVDYIQNLWDIGLFVLAGILVILLMEQLYKLAVYQGMRQTIQVLEPFLSQFRDL